MVFFWASSSRPNSLFHTNILNHLEVAFNPTYTFKHLTPKALIGVFPIAGPSGKILAPINIVGVVKVAESPLMEVEEANGKRLFTRGSVNQ